MSHTNLTNESLRIIEPRGWKKSVVSIAQQQTKIEGPSKSLCQVCSSVASKYCCPKCSIAYCSLDCYRQHSSDCTERFYKDKVTQQLELERDQGGEIYEILNRVRQLDDEEGSDGELGVEELERVKHALENNQEFELSPEIRAAFEKDVQYGEFFGNLTQEWSPWWETKLGDDLDQDDESKLLNLDKRLLKIPPFSKLCSNKVPPPCLEFNLVSILGSICYTLRLYGPQSQCIEAAEMLVESSDVLGHNVNYDSLEHVFMQEGRQDLLDVATILSNARHIAHLLLDAIDILKASEKETKIEDREYQQKVRRIRKKLEFYLSWSRTVDLTALSDQVQEWHAEWRSRDDDVKESLKI